MTIVGVGESELGYEILVARNETVKRMGVHEFPSTLKLLPAQVRPGGKDTPHPFFMDFIRPLSTDEISDREVHEKISERRRVQHAGIVHCDQYAQDS